MANLLAIVSQSGLRDIEQGLGAVCVGQVTPLTAYHSKNKRLDGLKAGGALFAVTVRESRLWLVAILENPSFDGTSWTAPPNRVPVVDISDLVPELRFSNGKGLTTPPNKWAMSLQTPRELTDDDVVLLRAEAQPGPGTAYHAAMIKAVAEGVVGVGAGG